MTVALLLGFAGGFGTAILLRAGGSAVQQSAGAVEPEPASGSSSVGSNVVSVRVTGRPFKGPERAAVTLVEFTDYQCPFCARHFRETYPGLLAGYEGKLKYVIRNFPVPSLHRYAQKAAEAAECALEQGKFWEYHDTLFRHTTTLQVESLKRYAAEVGLDVGRFNRCLDSGEKGSIVSRDVQDGRRYGVRGTPTFFINGRILVGAQPLEVFKAEIDRAFRGG